MATRGTVVYSPGFIFLPLVLCKYQFLPRDSGQFASNIETTNQRTNNDNYAAIFTIKGSFSLSMSVNLVHTKWFICSSVVNILGRITQKSSNLSAAAVS